MSKAGEESKPSMLFASFLESAPPVQPAAITDLTKPGGYVLNVSEIQLHCWSELCSGMRVFSSSDTEVQLSGGRGNYRFLFYSCRNCRRAVKTFALLLTPKESGNGGTATKLGENPAFGPPVPARVITMIGPDRELFLKGRRCENQGLGIASLTYYRRVVEDQKGRLIDHVKRVAQTLGASVEILQDLERASQETQFSKAVEQIKHAIPQALMIKGNNPLTLLHAALSEGVHELSDEDCLARAQAIRIVLTELSERIGDALKDEAELSQAVAKLVAIRTENKTK